MTSYNSKAPLEELVLRYAYDKYHGSPTDQYGIELDYDPHSKFGNVGRVARLAGNGLLRGAGLDARFGEGAATLTIDPKRYSPVQADRIALGAGYKTYYYGDDEKTVSLAANPKKQELEEQVKDGKLSIADAQKKWNTVRRQQYAKYGIDETMLRNKTALDYNQLFGIVPVGYNGAQAKSIISGHPVQKESPYGVDSPLIAEHPVVYYDKKHPNGRFRDDNFDIWKKSRMEGNPGYQNPNLTKIIGRAATSSYALGFPVAKNLRTKLKVQEGRPDPDTVDYRAYYELDTGRGTRQMQPWIYNEAAKNPQAMHDYMGYILEHNTKKGPEREEADRLAKRAGLPRDRYYHRMGENGGIAKWNSPGGHDMRSSLKSFYENGFNPDGTLKQDFKYTESGYDHYFDGGNYTVKISKGRPVNAQDNWNMGFGNMTEGSNDNAGFYMINRFLALGGKLKRVLR